VRSQVRRHRPRQRVVRSSDARHTASAPCALARPRHPARTASPPLAPLTPAACAASLTHARRVARQEVPVWRVSPAAAAHSVHGRRCGAHPPHTVQHTPRTVHGGRARAAGQPDAHPPVQTLRILPKQAHGTCPCTCTWPWWWLEPCACTRTAQARSSTPTS
jgi:hypothetical protein